MNAYRGMDVCAFLESFVKESAATATGIRRLYVLEFIPVPGLPERLSETPEQYRVNLRRRSEDADREVWLPQYEAAMIDRFEAGTLSPAVLQQAAWHDTTDAAVRRRPIDSVDFTAATLRGLAAKQPRSSLALSSRVTVASGEERHLTLMDFQCPVRPGTLPAVITALEAIGEETGVVVESGRSYHYYGSRLLTIDEWRTFLGRCLLLSPLTDTRYIGHRLIAGETSLRIAADTSHTQPTVVACLNTSD